MKYLKFIAIPLLSAIFIVLFFMNVNLQAIGKILAQVHLLYPLVYALAVLPQFLLRSYRWRLLLSPYKKEIPLRRLFNFTMIGYMISYLLPGRVGEIARPILLAEKEKIKKSSAIATVILERLFDFLVILLLFFVSLLFIKNREVALLRNLRNWSTVLLPIVIMIFLLTYLVNLEQFFVKVERIIRRIMRIFPKRIGARLAEFLLHFIRGLRLNGNFLQWLKIFGCSLLLWLFVIPSYWVLMLGFKGMNVSLFETVPFFAVIFVSSAIPTPGMVGSLDLASKIALVELYGVDVRMAVAYTVLYHFLLILVPVVLGLIALWQEGVHFNTLREIRKEKDELSAV